MPYYWLAGRTELLPNALWGGTDPTLYLPEVPQVRPPLEPWFWVVDRTGARRPFAWPGGMAVDVSAWPALLADSAIRRSPRPWMSYVPCHPHRIPPAIRKGVRHVLGWAARVRPARGPSWPRWPIEPTGAVCRAVARVVGCPLPPSPWPPGQRYALCLSHDVDSAAGQRQVLPLAEIEERLGLRSAWFLAPGNYRVDRGLWREMAARGHEIGSHGWAHDFKLPYLDPRSLADRLDRSRHALGELPLAGFRSPAFLRTPGLLEAVADRFLYDSSVPDTLRLHGPSGSGWVFPFPVGRLVEIPVTLPYDGELMALGRDRRERGDLWLRKARWVRDAGGLVHLLTHPDPQFTASHAERELYRQVLERLLSDDARPWHALPREIASRMQLGPASRPAPPEGWPAVAAGLPAGWGAPSVPSFPLATPSWSKRGR